MVTSKKSLSTSISISKASDETITDDTDNAIPNDIEVPLYYCDENISVKAVNQTRRAERTLYAVSLLAFLFIITEFFGGYFANSLAVMTDAGHMTTDLLSFLISIAAIKLARLKPTKIYSFGFHRAEVLGALLSILTIWILTIVLVYLAVERIIEDNFEVDANIMLITACISIIFNIIMGIILMIGKNSHSHFGMSHSHSHDGNKKMQQQSNINVRAAFIHVLGDLVQSFGVLIAAFIIKLTNFRLADPLCTFFFSFLVLITTLPVLRDALIVLMEATPRHINVDEIHRDLLSINGVQSIHSLRVWSLSIDKTAVSVHLNTDKDCDLDHIIHEANERLRLKHDIGYRTVQAQCLYNKTISLETLA